MSQVASDTAGARTLPTAEELAEAFKIDVFDRVGAKTPLGELIREKRSLLVFTRHFWCMNCQAYVRVISETIPPSSLPENTQVIIISNGSYQPIDTYASVTSSAYSIYTDPTCRLHKILKFKSALKEQEAGEEKKDYMQNAGTAIGRVFGGIKGALGNLQHIAYIGPKALNGGEMVISSNGRCEFMHRMQNTVDHTNVAELASIIGVKPFAVGQNGPSE